MKITRDLLLISERKFVHHDVPDIAPDGLLELFQAPDSFTCPIMHAGLFYEPDILGA